MLFSLKCGQADRQADENYSLDNFFKIWYLVVSSYLLVLKAIFGITKTIL